MADGTRNDRTNDDVVLNELLCFVKSYFGKMPNTEIVSVIIEFYEEEEIVTAKRMIFDISDKLKVEGAPRMKCRTDGTNKRRPDCVFDMFEILDKKSVELPQFHAVNLHRLPRITPSDVDNVRMAENISELKEHVAALTHQVNEIVTDADDDEVVCCPN